ncbi:MAG TPA: N-acetylmuramoyl-L-alanine amidase [Limnochordales bacterium]
MAQVRRGGIRWLLGCLAVLLCACPGWAQVKLILDGRPVAAGDALLLIGTGLGLSQAVMTGELGIDVDDSAWPVVQLRAGERVARIEAGQRAAVLDGRAVQLQATPVARDGMLYVPLHLVADLAGLRVEYDLTAGVLRLHRRGTEIAGLAGGSPAELGNVAAPRALAETGGPPRSEDAGRSAAVAAAVASAGPPLPSAGSPSSPPPARDGDGARTAPGPAPRPASPAPEASPAAGTPVVSVTAAARPEAAPAPEARAAPAVPAAAPEESGLTARRADALDTVPQAASARERPAWRPPGAIEPLAAEATAGPERPAKANWAVPGRGPAEPAAAPGPAAADTALAETGLDGPAAEPGPVWSGSDAAALVALFERSAPEADLPWLGLEAFMAAPEMEWWPLDGVPVARGPGRRGLPTGQGTAEEPEPTPEAEAPAEPPAPSALAALREPAPEPAPAPAGAAAPEDEPAEQQPVQGEQPDPSAGSEPKRVDKPEAAGMPEPSPPPAVLPAFPISNAGRVLLPEGAADGALLDVRVRTLDGRQELVVITDGPVEVRAVYLPEPDRLVVDLPGATLATDWRVMPMDGVVMRQLRVSGEQAGVRLVADLTAPTGYTLLPAEDHPGFVVRLNHQLRAVRAAPVEGGRVALEAEVSGGPIPYQAFILREPWRVVVDLFDVTVSAPLDLPLGQAGVRAVRVSQFRQDAARVVLELDEPVAWPTSPVSGQAHPGPDGRLAIVLDADGQLAFNPRMPTGAMNLLEFVGFVRENGSELVLLQGRGPLDAQVRRFRQPERIVLDMPGVLLERTLGPLTPPDGAVVTAVRAGQADPNTGRVVVETRQVAEHQVLFSPDRTRAVLSVRPSQLAGRVVVVDAGHGGRDPGAIGPGGTQEKDVNLAIARQVALYLEQAGARVILTRDRDVYVELANRSRMANALGADVFVSIHADAIGPGRTASGTGTFYYPGLGEAPEIGANARLGYAVHRELLAATGLPDRGVRQRAFHVLIHTEMPAVLVEVAFIDNPAEERLLNDPEFQRRAAMGIAQGVVRYFAELRAEPLPRTVVDWDGELEQVAAAFLEKGDLPADVLVVRPAAALGTASEAIAQTPEL